MSAFLERLRRYADDRGMMANLRCVMVENKKHRAWPALNRLGVKVDDVIPAFIAGLYATHPEETSTGNFGTTCKAIERERNETTSKDNKLTPTERRFQHLLAAAGWDELSVRVYRMVRMARARDVRVNYVQLETDLTNWVKDRSDITRTKWAAKFWTTGTTPADEEDV